MKTVRFSEEGDKKMEEFAMDDDDLELGEEHDKMIAKLTESTNNKKGLKWKANRWEASDNVNQFGLNKDKRASLSLHKLVNIVKDGSAKKAVKNFENKQIIARPLNEPLAKKASRRVNFAEVTEEITKYDSIVKEMQKADQIVFPLEDSKVSFNVNNQLDSKNKKSRKPVEEEINRTIAQNLNMIETEQTPLTEYELSLLKSKSVEEASLIHRELQKRRLLLSYQEAKFRRQRKIKSKKYHRLEKKKKLKNSVEDFEKLVEDDTDKAAQTLEELDRLRALERASLKHRNTGKWAKHNKLRAKYDDQAREALEQQMKLNAELMKKRKLLSLTGDEYENNDDEETEDKDSKAKVEVANDMFEIVQDYNPWVSTIKANKKRTKQTEIKTNDDEKFFAERIKKRLEAEKEQEKAEIFIQDALDVHELIEGDEEHFEQRNMRNLESIGKLSQNKVETEKTLKTENIDANVDNLIQKIKDVKSKAQNVQLDSMEDLSEDELKTNDEDDDGINFDDAEMRNYISEAFADDDVIQDFLNDKAQKEAEEVEGEDARIIMPGWGSWAGQGIQETKKHKQKAKRKMINKQRKLDNKICNAIILPNEQIESAASKYKIQFCPKNVNNMKSFQSSILKPIGSTFNPQSVFKRMIEPKVITKMGCIIEPMQQARIDKQTHL